VDHARGQDAKFHPPKNQEPRSSQEPLV
jgi:hypothetical protein